LLTLKTNHDMQVSRRVSWCKRHLVSYLS